jgi:hypothetical protein
MYSHQKQQEIRSSLEFKHFILDEYNAHQDMHRARAVAARYFSIKVSLDYVKRLLRLSNILYKRKDLARAKIIKELV